MAGIRLNVVPGSKKDPLSLVLCVQSQIELTNRTEPINIIPWFAPSGVARCVVGPVREATDVIAGENRGRIEVGFNKRSARE
jgi:hypothetical protein